MSACLHRRLFFWPGKVCNGFRIAPLSSRLGRRLDQKRNWFAALRTLACRLSGEQTFVWVKGTASAEATTAVARLFGCSCLELVAPEAAVLPVADIEKWLAECRASAAGYDQVFVSPVIAGDDAEPLDKDQLLIAAAERGVVLECRSGGRLQACLTQELPDRPGSFWVSVMKGRKVHPACDSLIQLGAVPWILEEPERAAELVPSNDVMSRRSDGPLESPEGWLCHWTRPTKGEWPEQSRDDYFAELLLDCRSADRSALATLLRILVQQKLYATVSRAHQNATVSWTAVPLAKFRSLREYRRHRQRFDFEPWGIAVRKSVLLQKGTQEVTYVDGASADGVLTQPRQDRSGKIDWSIEQEWRSIGDFEFDQIAREDICVFVDSESNVQAVSEVCSYDVIVVPHDD